MDQKLRYIFITCFGSILAKEELTLPLCPTNVNYLPQDLPMHCRMPRSANFAGPSAGVIPGPPQPYYQSPDKQINPIPGGPFGFPGPLPGALPGGPPGAFPLPMPMMPMPQPAHKLPVIVMPFYSPDPAFKKSQKPSKEHPSKEHGKRPRKRPRRPRRPQRPRNQYSDANFDGDTDTDTDDSDTDVSSDTSSDTSGGDASEAKKRRRKGKRGRSSGRRSYRNRAHKSKKKHTKVTKDLLTPVLQYVTKDGYVIFEKEISKNEAQDWLKIKQDNEENASGDKSPDEGSEAVGVKEQKSKKELHKTTEKGPIHKKLFQH